MPRVLYHCDPVLNVACKKGNCHIHGGPCRFTANPQFAKKDTTALFVFDVNEEDFPALTNFKEDDLND